jgi:hypothetical protein
VALFGLARLAAPAPALSQVTCGCYLSYCPARDSPFLRFELATPLAPNARILARLSGFDPGSVELETTAGDPVAFALEPAGDAAGTAYWIVPAAPLMPGDYLLSATSRAERSVATEAFSVAARDDVTPPAVSGLRVAGVSVSNYCSELVGGAVSYSAVDPGLVYTAVALEVELWRGGVRFARVFPAQAYRSQPTEFGTSPAPDCFGAAHVDGLREGEELTAPPSNSGRSLAGRASVRR